MIDKLAVHNLLSPSPVLLIFDKTTCFCRFVIYDNEDNVLYDEILTPACVEYCYPLVTEIQGYNSDGTVNDNPNRVVLNAWLHACGLPPFIVHSERITLAKYRVI